MPRRCVFFACLRYACIAIGVLFVLIDGEVWA